MEVLRGMEAVAAVPDLVRGKELILPDRLRRDPRFGHIRAGCHSILIEPAQIRDVRPTFGRERVDLTLHPYHQEGKLQNGRRRGLKVIVNQREIPFDVRNLKSSRFWHMLMLKSERRTLFIAEHVGALLGFLNLLADLEISTAPNGKKERKKRRAKESMPTFNDCNGPFLDAIAGKIEGANEQIPKCTVKEKMLFRFGKEGGYWLIEPPEEGKEDQLILEIQYSYPNTELGTKSLETVLTPEIFAAISRARAPAIGWVRQALVRLLSSFPFPGVSLSTDSVMTVTNGRIINRNPEFDEGGENLELACHKLIDHGFPIAILEQTLGFKLVGKLSVYRASHATELEILLKLLAEAESLFIPVASREGEHSSAGPDRQEPHAMAALV